MNIKTKQVSTFNLKDREEPITGFVLSSQGDWVCIHLNNIDLSFDGIVYFPKRLIDDIINSGDEAFLNKVYQARNFEINKRYYSFALTLDEILKLLADDKEIIQIETDDEDVCYLGIIKTIDDKEITIQTITSKGKLDEFDVYFRNEINILEFKNDYIESLKSILYT